jgi:hypothetical protein
MKHIFIIASILFSFLLFFNLNKIDAAPLQLPIGGRVMNPTPGVVCASLYGGPYTILPFSQSSPSFYIVSMTAKVYLNYIFKPGVFFKGLYSPIPDLTSCKTTSSPPAPFPVFKIIMFGSSSK